MKTIIQFCLCFALLFSTANASTIQGLKEAFDEFNYAINVEWDQQDPVAYQNHLNLFSRRMKELYTQGLTRSEMLTFLKMELKDHQLAKDIEIILSMVEMNKMTDQEAFQFISDSVNKSYQQGASWSSAGKVLLIIGGVVATLFITYILLVKAYEAIGRWVNNWGGDPNCRDEYICREDCYNGTCQPPFCAWEVVCH